MPASIRHKHGLFLYPDAGIFRKVRMSSPKAGQLQEISYSNVSCLNP